MTRAARQVGRAAGDRRSPSVAVVIPTFHSPRFLARAVDSVVSQGVAGVECVVMDGGTDDDTAAILRGYGDEITWVRAPDDGQADAIDTGFRRVDAELVGWLNADDALLPNAIEAVVQAAAADPAAVLFFGDVQRIDAGDRVVGHSKAIDIDGESMRRGRGIVLQPGSFYRGWAVQACGGVDKSFYLLMDVDLWIRLLAVGPAHRIDRTLAQFRVHADAKSSEKPYRYYYETLRIAWRHESDRPIAAAARRARQIGMHYTRWQASKLWSWLTSAGAR